MFKHQILFLHSLLRFFGGNKADDFALQNTVPESLISETK